MPWIGIGRSKYHDWVTPLRQGQRAQRLGAARPLAHRRRERPHLQLRPRPSARRLSPPDLHDARCRCRRLQPGQRLPRPQERGTAGRADAQRHQERHRLRAAADSPTSSGTSMSATSTSPAPFTSCAPSSMATAASSSTGKSARKWRKPTWKPSSNAPAKRYPDATPRIITDNGPQFIAKDFKEFIRIAGMTHVRTSPYYPQSNGKIERWHKTIKGECIRVQVPLSLEDARRLVTDYVEHYNTVRLHSAIGYVTPKDKLEGRDQADLRRTRPQAGRGPRTPPSNCARAQHEQPQSPPAVTSAPPSTSPPSAPPSPSPRSCSCSASSPLRPRRPAARRLSLARLDPRHRPAASASTSTEHTFHCFKCGRSGNALDLWAYANRLTIYDAAVDLCQRLNIPLPLLHGPEQRRGTRSPGS